MARRRLPPAAEPPAWVRAFVAADWSDWSDYGGDGIYGARQRWNAARFRWCEAHGLSPVDLLREEAEAKRRLA